MLDDTHVTLDERRSRVSELPTTPSTELLDESLEHLVEG
jgi:hypothetical protein